MALHPSRVRSAAAALFLTMSLSFPLAAGAADRAASPVVDAATIGIDNFGRVDAALYRGSQPTGGDYEHLKAVGVKTIINLTSDDADPTEQAMAERAGLKYVQIPMTTHTPPSAAQLDQFLRVVNDPANQPAYVHCVGGRHRTGVMTAAYRMTTEGWTAEQAFNEMKQYKFGADFLHPEFKSFVYGYHPSSSSRAAAVDASAQR